MKNPTDNHPFAPILVLRDRAAFRALVRDGRLEGRDIRALALFVALSTAVYGAALAAWRSPVMAFYVAVKLPVVFLGTTALVAGFAWLTALASGADVRLRDTVGTLLGAMSLAGWALLALAPVAHFMVWSSAPAWDPVLGRALALRGAHHMILLVHFTVICTAGLLGNATLYTALRDMVPANRRFLPLFIAWVAAFGLVGSQMTWILRPILGSPNIDVAFLRADALDGNFFESIFRQVLPYLLAR